MDRQQYRYTARQLTFMNYLRELWEEHIMWTRSFIISTAANLRDLDAVTNRLLQNPADFANALGQLYDKPTAYKFKDLFTEHLLIAAQLVTAAKNANNETVITSRKKWYENADAIAAFLADINPYWQKEKWREFLYDHLKMTENEAVERLNKRFAEDVTLYDSIEAQALEMADYMSEGLIRQFQI